MIIANQWLRSRLGRPLVAAEAQTFGRMVLDAWRHRYGPYLEPYTVRVGKESSQRTAYLPEHEPLLEAAYRRYLRCKSYQRVQAMLKEAGHGATER